MINKETWVVLLDIQLIPELCFSTVRCGAKYSISEGGGKNVLEELTWNLESED